MKRINELPGQITKASETVAEGNQRIAKLRAVKVHREMRSQSTTDIEQQLDSIQAQQRARVGDLNRMRAEFKELERPDPKPLSSVEEAARSASRASGDEH